MIQEWLWAVTAAASPAARRLGHHRALALYMGQARRHAGAWEPHLRRSRQFILDAARAARGRNLAVIAGSGPCLDTPMETLSWLFKTVVLLDVVHPRATRLAAARLGNVHCLDGDLTGVLDAVAVCLRARGRPPLPKPACRLLADETPDLVISVNTLAGLPTLLMERLWATGQYTDEALDKFAHDIIAGHLTWLKAFGGVRRLVTDISWLRIGRDNVLACDPLHRIQLPPPLAQWDWPVAPKPEAHPDCDLVHRVAAIEFLPEN